MAFVSVEDPKKPKTSPLNGIFACPQNDPAPEGYIGEIDDEDPRIASFHEKQILRFKEFKQV